MRLMQNASAFAFRWKNRGKGGRCFILRKEKGKCVMIAKKEGWQWQAYRVFMVVLGTTIMAGNIASFVHRAGLIPGGFTGFSLLVQEAVAKFTGVTIPYSLINIPLNSIPAYIGFRFIGKRFTMLSCLSIVLSGFLIDLMPSFAITDDMLLMAVFGGIINGTAISICLRGNTTTGGTDIISIFISERYGKDGFSYVLAGNVVILMVAGVLLGWDKALYSVIFQYASTQTLHVMFVRYQKNTMYIITEHTQEVYELIREVTHHDATLFTGIGCYEGKERKMLYSVVSSDEIRMLMPKIREVDPRAFVNVAKSERIWGRFYQRPND